MDSDAGTLCLCRLPDKTLDCEQAGCLTQKRLVQSDEAFTS